VAGNKTDITGLPVPQQKENKEEHQGKPDKRFRLVRHELPGQPGLNEHVGKGPGQEITDETNEREG